MKPFLITFLVIAVYSQKVYSQNEQFEPIRVYFKKGSLVVDHSKKELDSILISIDSLVRKYKVIKVIPISPTYESRKNKFLNAQRAQIALDLCKSKHIVENGRFYINIYAHDDPAGDYYLELEKRKNWVSFEPFYVPLPGKSNSDVKKND
jgi:hypothetical protein